MFFLSPLHSLIILFNVEHVLNFQVSECDLSAEKKSLGWENVSEVLELVFHTNFSDGGVVILPASGFKSGQMLWLAVTFVRILTKASQGLRLQQEEIVVAQHN